MTEAAPGAADLVRRIEAGDPEAERELVERYGNGLLFMLQHLTGDRQRAEDFRQETLRIVLEKVRAGELREPEKLPGFLRGTARNLLLGEARRAGRRRMDALPEDAPDPADPAPSPLEEVLRAEDRRRVRQVLGELRSGRDREVLFRYHVAEEDKDGICRHLGLSSRQFNLVLFRARQRFRELLEQLAGEARVKSAGRGDD